MREQIVTTNEEALNRAQVAAKMIREKEAEIVQLEQAVAENTTAIDASSP